MATKRKKAKNPPLGGAYDELRYKHPVDVNGRAKYWDTFDLWPQTSDSVRDVTFTLPEKVTGVISLHFQVIREANWPVFAFHSMSVDAIPGRNYACRVSFVGDPIDKTHIYRCYIEVHAAPKGGKDKKKAKPKLKK